MHDPWTWTKGEIAGGNGSTGWGGKYWDNYNSVIYKIYFKKEIGVICKIVKLQMPHIDRNSPLFWICCNYLLFIACCNYLLTPLTPDLSVPYSFCSHHTRTQSRTVPGSWQALSDSLVQVWGWQVAETGSEHGSWPSIFTTACSATQQLYPWMSGYLHSLSQLGGWVVLCSCSVFCLHPQS